MLISAAVCPHPPLLVPQATGADHAAKNELDRLRAACRSAVASVLAYSPDLIAIIGGAADTVDYPPTAAGGLHDYGIPFTIGNGPLVLPLSLTIGRWLLDSALAREAPSPRLELKSLAFTAQSAECLKQGAEIASLAPRVALLVMGDGTARRARQAPGALDPEAERYDAEVAAALAAADTAKLAALDPAAAADLFVAGRAPWQVLAGAANGAELTTRLHYAAAPYEVTYLVATWHHPR